jgi:radical SAM-linked protein
MMEETKIRFKFIRIREYRYLSHLDVVRQLMMALSRTALPLKYSQGFHPNIKINFSYPVPVGLASFAEYGDLTVLGKICPLQFKEKLNQELHASFKVLEAKVIDKKTPSLMQDIDVIAYVFKIGISKKEYEKIQDKWTEGFAQECFYSQSHQRFLNVDVVLLTLFGYTKSANDKMSFKFNDFLSHLRNLTYIYNFKILNYYKREAYVFRDDTLITPTGL